MANDHDDFAEWRDSMESRVTILEKTVRIEARTRAQMDLDMSDLKTEFRAQRKLLQALQDTQSEHTAMLREHTNTLREHTNTLRGHSYALAELRTGQKELRQDVTQLRQDVTETRVGIQTIIDLLKSAGDDRSGGNSPN